METNLLEVIQTQLQRQQDNLPTATVQWRQIPARDG